MPFIWQKYMHVFILTQLNILPEFCQFWKIMFKKSNLFGPTPKVVSRFLLAYKEQRAKNHMVGNHLKSDNLQYNTLGRSSHQPSVWWSKYYFDRLKIKQWVAGLDRILQEIMKKNNTWNIRHLVDETIVPSTQQLTVLFSIFQNNTWTIRHLVDEMNDKLVGFMFITVVESS